MCSHCPDTPSYLECGQAAFVGDKSANEWSRGQMEVFVSLVLTVSYWSFLPVGFFKYTLALKSPISATEAKWSVTCSWMHSLLM